jgi:hypothetical protein
MKNITNHKARQAGKRDLVRVFRDCRYKDGLTIGTEDTAAPDDFIYYCNKARDGQVGNYVVYEVIASDAARRADDAVIGREFFAQVDVFSVRSFESKPLQETLNKLEEKLTAAGFEVEAGGENYEPDTRLYHQVYYVSKMYL